MKEIIKNQNGVTLIEAMIAMMILAVGFLGVNMMQVSATQVNTSANKVSIAGATGESIYETLTNRGYSDPVFTVGTHNVSELTGFALPGSISTATWNVTQWSNSDTLDNDGDGSTDEDDENDIKFVALTVTYNDNNMKNMVINFLKSEIY
ncbi:prepilin-type N-terminal cleavage/methylation domain-containing protein [uncultured Desulfobacter sp.]|uniref:prepilin-type N-terminal cleavage/methylation domain-containing protein n=1 Tax=uncultured Desulfobacter sp. TaxID=240139 RepID=UPI002AAC3750|nr:prepilin-type N-terminal cleavage/methylation domain-containing protein [uncultured Desulfobacter sp.]